MPADGRSVMTNKRKVRVSRIFTNCPLTNRAMARGLGGASLLRRFAQSCGPGDFPRPYRAEIVHKTGRPVRYPTVVMNCPGGCRNCGNTLAARLRRGAWVDRARPVPGMGVSQGEGWSRDSFDAQHVAGGWALVLVGRCAEDLSKNPAGMGGRNEMSGRIVFIDIGAAAGN